MTKKKFTALLKEIVNSSKKVSMLHEDGGLCTLMQNHLFLDMVISVQIVSLIFASRSSSLLVIIIFLTKLINPPPLLSLLFLLSLSLQFFSS